MKKLNLIGIWILALIMLALPALAVEVTDSHWQTDEAGTSVATRQGEFIKINTNITNNVTLRKVSKWSLVTATTAALYASDTTTSLASSAFVGNVATFNYNLTKGTTYLVIAWSGGANYNRRYDCTGIAYPYNGTNLAFTGAHDQASNQSACVYNIVNVTTEVISEIPHIDSSKIDLLFSNITYPSTYQVLFGEGENFNVFVNYTNATGSPYNSSVANCSVSIVDGITETFGNDSNFTVCNVGCDFVSRIEQFSMITTTNAISDIVHFNGCHDQLAQGILWVNLSCGAVSDFRIITPDLLPLCSDGTEFVWLESEICNSSVSVNVTVSANIIHNRRKQVRDLAVDRRYSVMVMDYSSEVFFNYTLSLWAINHDHEFYEPGVHSIFANCTHTNVTFSNSTSENITIVNSPPIIFINQVVSPSGVNTALYDGVVIDFEFGNWTFLVSVLDDNLDFVNVTVRNFSTNIIFTTGNVSTIVVSSDLLRDFDGNPFSINVTANDTFNAQTNASLRFNMTDTTDPSCNFSAVPVVVEFGNFTFDILCTDDSFFSLNVSCPNNNFSNSSSGMNVESFVFNSTFFINVSDTCSFRYCDAHTANKLVGYWDAYTSESRIQITSNFVVVADVWTDSPGGVVSYDVLEDRVSYVFDMSASIGDKFVFFVNASGDSFYFPSDKYLGWLVIDGSYWLDFNSDSLDVNDKVKVKKLGNGLWEVSVKAKDKIIRFDSIGELNCVSGSFMFSTPFRYTLSSGTCPSSIAGVLTLWLVFFFALFLITAGWIWKLRETGFFGSLLLITVSWTVVACHLWAGYVCVGIGVYYLFWFILKK